MFSLTLRQVHTKEFTFSFDRCGMRDLELAIGAKFGRICAVQVRND
jgi:hypothetical protein